MKIAIPISSFLPNIGGMEVGAHNLAKNLVKLGHQPIVITSFSIYKKLKKEKVNLPYKVTYFFPRMFYLFSKNKALGMFLSEKYFMFLQRKYKFDFWHITMGFPLGVMFINYSIKHKFNNYIIRCVGEDIQQNRSINYGYSLNQENKAIIDKYFPLCKNFIAISKSISERYKDLGIKCKAIHNIPNGVSTERFIQLDKKKRIKLRKKYGITEKDKVFISLGRNHPKKNYKFLIKLIYTMKRHNISNKYLLVGQGVNKFKNKIKSLNLTNQVILVDTNNNIDTNTEQYPSLTIINFLLISDFFIFPSILESFGVVIIEAMAAGLPIIANHVPGSKDIIHNNKTGFLLNNINDVNSFMEKIELLSGNNKLVKQMKINCIKESKKYDWKEICKKYLRLYEKIIKENIEKL